MALTSWKAFRFFDVSQVRFPDGDGAVSLDQTSTSCVSSGSDRIFVGTPSSVVHILDQSFKSTRSWKAHDAGSITHIVQLPDTAYLLTLAETLQHEPELKVWTLEHNDKKTGNPRCLCQLTVQNGRKNFPVSAVSVTSDLAQLAVGFANGAVTVVRGDLIHDRGTRQRTVFESEEPITGLEFREANTTALYIATTSRILALAITGKAQGTPARSLDESGCAVGCMKLDPHSNELVVARDDAIYTYGPRGKTGSNAYEGVKKLVDVHKDYVLVVSPPASNLGRATGLRAFAGTRADEIFNTSTFSILNTDLKFIAHSEAVSSQISSIFTIWGDIFLLTIDGKLYRYHEKSFQQKLEDLYRRDLYVLAINMAQKYKVDAVQQNVIFRRYGDYLYQRGDYDTAMQQYLRAIDNTEPSQIIRRFLDNQRIRNLIDYLEELHEHNKATSDHTTLLLNCYAKLKDVDKLEEFIKQPGDLKFDLDTAILMCRQGGYYDQAAFLARRHEEHGLVVDILIEDLKKYAEALAYIVRLEPKEAYPNFMKYGTVLLEHCPGEATQLFIDYFTGNFNPKKDAVIVQEAPATPQQSGGLGNMATSAAQNLASLIPLPYMSTSALQTPAAKDGGNQTTVSQAQVVETLTEGEYVPYEVPKPRTAFSAFIDHPDSFITFLEACVSSNGVQESNKEDLQTTLFEMYLHEANVASNSEEKAHWEASAKKLIEQQDGSIDTSNILLLSDLEKFRQGTILVSEKQGLRFDVFRSYTAAKDTQGAIKALRKYGPEEPQLYPTALAYFTSSPSILAEASAEVENILQKIDADGLMAPLQVIQTLSTNPVATMGLVKTYLSRTLSRERGEIAANRKLIDSYRGDTQTQAAELQDLATKPQSFSATRCSACGRTLELPTVHFMCKHSFHQSCLGLGEQRRDGGDDDDDDDDDDGGECPICAPRNLIARQMREAQIESAGRHDLFEESLRGAAKSETGRFGVIGDWFGRGVMSVKGPAGTTVAE
ncbi:Vacuolar sorting-associated 11 [Lecanosticta acicola]|uniref:E3 ubiquitin-protein ligase PEP5 n=1 Tax=Lecanosticta acicola TaxID=111012 RepID=A0AAI8YU35_9PEZI|nr:Vacuolar sorting-associated 11 [Lecanosticta acicola]